MVRKRKQTAILISIGKEILRGKTLDSDAQYLAEKLTGLGCEVTRIVVVDDEKSAIGKEIRDALKRRPSYIFTTGGLGPTFDDMTLPSVGLSLGRKMILHKEALAQVKGYYREMKETGLADSDRMGPTRRKMAILPQGSIPLRNPCGGAPGVQIQVQGTTIFCLPGVPVEMKAIFRKEINPRLSLTRIKESEEEVELRTRDESLVAPIVSKLMKKFPGIYVKSRVHGAKRGIRIKVTVHGRSKEKVSRAAAMLRRIII